MPVVRPSVAQHIAGWSSFLLSLLVLLAGVRLPIQDCPGYFVPAGQLPAPVLLFVGLSISGLAFAVLGRLLTQFRTANPIGWLMALLGVWMPLMAVASTFWRCAGAAGAAQFTIQLSAWLEMFLSTLGIAVLFILLPALFPTGAFLSPRWRAAVLAALGLNLALALLAALAPGQMDLNGVTGVLPFANPFDLPLPWLRQFRQFLFLAIPLSTVLGGLVSIAGFVARFRHARGDERQQLKWFAYFLLTVVSVQLLGFELLGALFYPAIFAHWSYGLIIILSLVGFPLVIGLAIFKYRLYDIDLLIRRTLQYSLLTGLLALIYFGLVTLLQSLFTAFSNQQSPLAVVLSTLAIAALFNPLRRRMQILIDRRFYRQKYNAEQALAQFAAVARHSVAFEQLQDSLIQVIQATVQPSQIKIWLKPTRGRQ